MSYDIALLDDNKNPANVIKFYEGGTQIVGGSREASLNVTYNYSDRFDFNGLDEKRAKDTIEDMEKAVKKLGTEQSENYWDNTPGNAGYAVFILLSWAKQFPEYTWEVT